jgi:uncharacterized membrane protein (UPF0127 family)
MRGPLFVAENETRGIMLVQRVRRADSFVTRLRGLTFRRRLGEGEALWLVGRGESRAEAAIHMFFVFFPIGVLWLDRAGHVVDKVLARPFRPFYVPQSPALGVLECGPEVLDRVEIGDRLRFVPYGRADEK